MQKYETCHYLESRDNEKWTYIIIMIIIIRKEPVGILGPGVHYLSIFQAYGPIQGWEVVRGREIFI